MSEARVRVSLTEGLLEFEGPEKFVADLVEKFGSVIQKALAGESPETNDVAAAQTVADDARPVVATVEHRASVPPTPDEALNDIFAATATGVQVLRTFPGSTKSARAVNLAKLYLYGLQALRHRDTASFSEIARVCRTHGCYDANNMAASLKADWTSFVFGGTGKRQTIKLSAPGMERTEALISEIRAAGYGIARRRQGISPDAMMSARQSMESTPIHIPTPAGPRES